jgi:hypothetical protein
MYVSNLQNFCVENTVTTVTVKGQYFKVLKTISIGFNNNKTQGPVTRFIEHWIFQALHIFSLRI